MNRIFILAAVTVSLSAVMCGCSGKDDLSEPPAQSVSEIDNVTETNDVSDDGNFTSAPETTTEPENHELQRDIQPAEGTYIYDYAGVLSAEAFAECNNYAEWLYETFLINAAVVTTDDIEGLTPEQYAEDAYSELYGGRGSGLLLLINNDTNEDYLYKTGSCLVSVSEDTQANEFYWATQEIIGGDYKSAVMRLLKLGESCPKHVFDNGGIFTSEQIAALETACTGGSADISVLATSNSTESSNEEICRSYYDRHYQENDGYMIMLDKATNTLNVVSDMALPAGLEAAVAEADTLAADLDYTGALNAVITALKG